MGVFLKVPFKQNKLPFYECAISLRGREVFLRAKFEKSRPRETDRGLSEAGIGSQLRGSI